MTMRAKYIAMNMRKNFDDNEKKINFGGSGRWWWGGERDKNM